MSQIIQILVSVCNYSFPLKLHKAPKCEENGSDRVMRNVFGKCFVYCS